MAISLKLIPTGLGALILMCALSACSKEGGYPSPNESGGNAAGQKSGQNDPSNFASLRITSWGPQSTKAGQVFNRQPDGQAAFWMIVNQSLDGSDSVIAMDGTSLHSAVSGSQITAIVPATFYAKAGGHTLSVIERHGAITVQSNSVNFKVQ